MNGDSTKVSARSQPSTPTCRALESLLPSQLTLAADGETDRPQEESAQIGIPPQTARVVPRQNFAAKPKGPLLHGH